MTKSMEITFPKLNHFWLDSGLLGLVVMLREVESDVEKVVNDVGFTLRGTEIAIQNLLENAYKLLIERYYNLSTKKQRDDTNSYNFFYDSKNDKFVPFSKKKSVGIAALIYNKQALPSQKQIMWEVNKKDRKKIMGKIPISKVEHEWKWGKSGTLPEDIEQFTNRINEFAKENELKIGPPAGLLVDGPNEVKPQVKIRIKQGKIKGQCYLCGEDITSLEEISQTIFPFITGSSGLLNFNSLCSTPEKVCWLCAFLGKFVPVNGFYLSQGDNLFAFFPYSSSLEKMLEVYAPLQDAKYDDPNLYKNFKHPLGFENFEGGYFQKSFEVAFAFLYTIYKKVLVHQKGEEDEGVLNWEEMCNLTISKAPLEFVVLHAESKGQTSMGKMVWPFRDSVYFFRLIKQLEEDRINIKEVMRLLIDFSQKNENRTLIRNRVCERIVKKRSTLDLIESHVFRIDNNYIKPLFDFVNKYEPVVRKEVGNMTIEEQDAAVTLGKRIGMVVGKDGKKGDLFALRKARRKADFLNELNRLQFKCNLTVPPDVYEGKLTDLNFVEFKQFCMIAALNSFHAATQPEKGAKS